MPLDDLFVEPFHVIRVEWRLEGSHFIEDAPQGPDVRFMVVRLVFSDLWAGIIGCSGLSIKEPLLSQLGDIHIAQFNDMVFRNEHVGRFEVSVVNVHVVKDFQTLNHLLGG